MAVSQNGNLADPDSELLQSCVANHRFSDIPPAIDIPASTFDSEVEVSLQDLPDDPTELCTLLENEKAAKNFWLIIALAYAKRNQLDLAVDILNKGLASLSHGATKEKLGLLSWICWLLMLKSRSAPRVVSDGQPSSDTKTKDYYLQLATSTLNEASRLNPSYPPLFLARGVLSLLRASLYPPKSARAGSTDISERIETLRVALKSFDESSKAFGGRNVMAIFGRARALYLLGRYSEALEAYQKILIKMPGLINPDPRVGIGCCYWQLGFKDQAKVAWERAYSLNPESKVANILLAVYYLYDSSQHNTTDPAFGSLYKVAMTQYTQKAFKLDKEYPMTCSLFASYFLLRKAYSTVETLARKAIEQTDVMAVASDGWYLLARKSHYEGDLALAAEHYSRSDQARGGSDKGFLPAKFGAVQMQVLNKDYDGAKFRLERMVQETKSPESMILLGALLAEGVFESQKTGLGGGGASSSSNNNNNNTKEERLADAKKAISLLESVRALWKDEKSHISPDESVLIYLSRLYETVAPEKSMQCLMQLEEIQRAQIAEDERPESEEQLETALRLKLPPQLLNNMGCFLYQSEKIAQAQAMFQAALTACVRLQEREADSGSNSNSDTDALVTTMSYNLGRAYEAANMADEAKKVYEGLLERHKDYTEAGARLTYIALQQSPTDEGPKRMGKLYETDFANLEVRALFGWYLSKSKKRVSNLAEDHEQRHYKHTLQYFDKHDRYSLTGMGNVHLVTARDMRRDTDAEKEKRRKMYERAVEFFDKALQLDPKNAYAAQGIAIALVDDKKDYGGAVQIFSKVRDTLRDASVYLNLGHVYAELRQFTRSIEHYETALAKDRARDAQVLACLGRVWFLKGKHEQHMESLKTALDYAKRARAVASEQIHLQFNVAFVQFQIAQLAYSLPEMQKTLEDVQDAADGLREAIETLDRIAKAKNPPYPATHLEQRALMGRSTLTRQLERALQNQKEYEQKNATKLQQAREARDAEIRRREEEVRKAQEVELERKQKIAEERQQMILEAQRLAEQRAAEERAREEAELTTESETGEKVKRRKKSTKRKKKKIDEDDDIDDDDDDGRRDSDFDTAAGAAASSSSRRATTGEPESDTEHAPKKRRRLERRSTGGRASIKYKSSELVEEEDSDEEKEEALAAAAHEEKNHEEQSQHEIEEPDQAQQAEMVLHRRRAKKSRQINDEDDEEEEEEEDLFGE